MNLQQIDSTIDYCKGRIKSFEKALLPIPFHKFDKELHDKNNRKLVHHKRMLEALYIARELEIKGEIKK